MPLEADVAVVGPRQDLWVGIPMDSLGFLHDPHEGLLRVGGPKYLPEVSLVKVVSEVDVGGDQDPPHRFHRGRAESHARTAAVDAQLLDDLCRMPVRGWRERTHLAAAVRMVRRRTSLRASRRGPRLTLYDNRHGRVHHAGPSQGIEPEDGGGGQAAAGRQPVRLSDLSAMHLRECVDELAQQGCPGMIPGIPGRVPTRVARAEVGRKVDKRLSHHEEWLSLAAILLVVT